MVSGSSRQHVDKDGSDKDSEDSIRNTARGLFRKMDIMRCGFLNRRHLSCSASRSHSRSPLSWRGESSWCRTSRGKRRSRLPRRGWSPSSRSSPSLRSLGRLMVREGTGDCLRCPGIGPTHQVWIGTGPRGLDPPLGIGVGLVPDYPGEVVQTGLTASGEPGRGLGLLTLLVPVGAGLSPGPGHLYGLHRWMHPGHFQER